MPVQKDGLAPGPRPGIREFWAARGKTSFWVTIYLGYTIGSVLGPLFHRAGVTPNGVTVLGFLVALAGVVTCGLGFIPDGPWSGVYLGCMLLLSYGLDCTDGTLARITNRCSDFGVLLDKFIDLLTFFVIAGGLSLAAKNAPPQNALIASRWAEVFPVLLIWSMAPRALFSVFSWLKDQQFHAMSRNRLPEPMTNARRLKRMAGNVADEPSFRVGLGIAWGAGRYWEFVILYNGLITVFLAIYVWDTWRLKR